MCPKLVKFVRDGNDWKIPHERLSDQSTVLGVTWEELKASAMTENPGKWYKDFLKELGRPRNTAA